jgi:carbonic anhydrase
MANEFERLAAGVRRFQERVFPVRRAFFARLAKRQSPEILFITCADSRIVPALITMTKPGELFVERNPGNLVPPYVNACVGESASVEYAVAELGVDHVVVCGHTDCGAVKGLLAPDKVGAKLPAVGRWLAHGAEAIARLPPETELPDAQARLRRLTELNVIVQLEHLRTHPSVAARLARKEIQLHGWVYDIGAGRVDALDASSGLFAPWPPG